jgi:hypothetical protein
MNYYEDKFSKYKFAICEIFHPKIHGIDINSSLNIDKHFIVNEIIDITEFYNDKYKEYINDLRYYYRNLICHYEWLGEPITHPSIRNYEEIIKQREKYIKLEIIKVDILNDGHEMVGYFKTFWIKIIQRRWKKIYKQRQEIIKKRKMPKSLREIQRNGKWNNHFPQFRL